MEGVPPSSMEEDVNLTSNQLDFQYSLEDTFMSELLLSPPEVPGNQSLILCNDHVRQNMVVDNNLINDSFQQTTQFLPSLPHTMTIIGCLELLLPFLPLLEGRKIGVPESMEEDVNLTSNQLDFQSLKDTFMSEPLSPPPEVPVNQSSILCNDQGGQNNVINDSNQQTTQFRTSFPETMMEGFQPSFIEEVDNMTWNQVDFQSLLSELELHSYVILKHILSEDDCLQLPPEVPDNQSSILCNDQGGQNNVTMTTMGDLDGTSSSWINQNEPNWPQTPSRYQPNLNLFDPQCASPMLPGPSMPLRDQQWTDYQLPMSNEVPAKLPGPQPPMNQWHHNSNIHQPQPGHGYMTPNATTSQHGGFNQTGPSSPAPRIQHFPNQGQVDQAFVIPNIDNMQQESFVPRNFGKSTRSQMDNLQVGGLQNQTARPNALNPGLDTSLQSRIRGLNTQQRANSLLHMVAQFDLNAYNVFRFTLYGCSVRSQCF
ncbi:hypothetical protein POTOM_058884 [Populus tomentosa]|uniref:Uncharacterized protein n=1 Tax=Populus tomentosa TaxID=118781 RepID=A0A8X7XP81_POPTO|nr:hypothetical protein POTOM_058884 [Populus tomentosa]